MAKPGEVAISVRGISKCFEMYAKPVHRLYQTLFAGRRKFYREFWALKDVSFDVRRGECVGIIGRNGAGKSTLLQIVTGTLQPTSGSIEVNGRIAALLELGSGFNPEFTGRDNIYMNASILGLTKEETDARYEEIVRFADIGDFIGQPVKTYSSGMMVRLAFAVNAFVEPDILIVDEALAVGDIGFQMKCYQKLKKLREAGTTLLFVSHDLYTITSQCQKVLYLENGRIKDFSSEVPRIVSRFREDIRKASIKYYEDNAASACDGLEQRFGTHDAVIESIEVIDPADPSCEKRVVDSGKRMLVRIVIESRRAFDSVVFGIGLWNVSGIEILGSNNLQELPNGFTLKPGRNEFLYETDFNVNRGEYVISAGIADIGGTERVELDQRWGMKRITFLSDWDQPGYVRAPFRLVKGG